MLDPHGYVWQPTVEQIAQANISKAIKELNLADYKAFHRWSVDHYADFWHYTIQQLKIKFTTQPKTICDIRNGMADPNWLPGARFNIIESCFQADPKKIAIIAQSEQGQSSSLTYQELNNLSNQIASAILASGVKPKEAIGIIMPMTPLAAAIYLGIIKAGCVVVGIAESFVAEEIRTRLQIAQVRAVFTSARCYRGNKSFPLYEKVAAANPKEVILIAEEGITKRTQDYYWPDFICKGSSEFKPIICTPNDHATILFSSGTTGEPKAIPWSHCTPIKCASDAYYHHDIKSYDILAWPTNLGWMMGPWLIYAALINQAAIAIYDGLPTGRIFGKFIQDAKVTLLGVVPSLVKFWRSSGCMEGLNWSSIKCFSSTGECSNAEDMCYLMQLAGNKPVIEYCGGTEIAGGYVTGTMVQPAIPATFTTPALGLDFVLFDEKGRLADKGEVGIIGPSIGLSTELLNRDHYICYYTGMPQLVPERLLRRHGDALMRLDNGYFQALGRADDTMNLGGIKISSAEIERVLNCIDGIKETAAIAIKPPGGGPEQLLICAVLEDASRKNNNWYQIMQQAIKDHLNPLFKIERIEWLEQLPRTASNKIMRRLLRNEYI